MTKTSSLSLLALLCLCASPALAQIGSGYAQHVNYNLQPAPAPLPETAGAATGGVGSDCCGSNCGSCDSCCGKNCKTVFAFGEYLYLRSRDSEVAYAVEYNGPATSPPAVPIQVGRTGVVDQDFDSGFRAGVGFYLDQYTTVTASYTMFETGREDRTDRTSGIINTAVRSMVHHPSTLLANSDSLFATATHNLSYDLADLDVRYLIDCSAYHNVNFMIGVRYAGLEQEFGSLFPVNGQESVRTDIDFDGIGVRLGLEGEQFGVRKRFFGYAKAHANLIPGEFRADYQQGQNFDASVVNTNWEAGRIVGIFDLEFGAGWQSRCGTWRFSAGYLFSAWTNTVKTQDFIQAVQTNNFNNLGSTMTFDGLVTRLEGRF